MNRPEWGASAAKIAITGVGGGGSDFNTGIWLQTLSNAISSVDGNVTLTGTATDSTGTGNDGVRILSGGGITITGTASLTTTGTAASSDPTGSDSFGINVGAAASTSVLSLAGTNTTFIADSMNITSTATINAAANTVALRPRTGGRSISLGAADSSSTLGLTDAELDRITAGTLNIGNASSGAITVSTAISHANNLTLTTGAGITFNQAVTMAADKSFSATTTSTSAAITLANTNADITTSGTGAASLTAARNISLAAGSSVTTVNGGITFTANPTGTATGNFSGIHVDGATLLTLGSGNISLLGFGADQAGTQLNAGIVLRNSTLVETRSSGNITLDGTGGNGTIWNDGLHIVTNVLVNSTAAATGKITMIGRGGASTTGIDNRGVAMGGNSLIRSQGSGDLEFTGFGGTTTSSNTFGFYLDSSIQSTGTGKVTIAGTGGSGINHSTGVWLNGGLVTSASGDVAITGTGGTASGESAAGIWVMAGADIQSTGGAKIALVGTAGIGQPWGTFGTWLEGDGTTITSNAGDIHLIGTGGAGSGDWNMGIWIYKAAILATGNAKVTIEGTGGSGVSSANGVALQGAGTRVTAVNGDITIEGHGGLAATGSFNRGVGVFEGTLIQSTGSGAINLIGFGGGGNVARGVELGSSGANITQVLSATGDISITGQGGSTNGNGDSTGVIVHSGTVIESTATASITIDGTGGSGSFSNEGVDFNGYGAVGVTRVRSVDGPITVIGRGGNNPGGRWNRGVGMFGQAVIQSTGSATITINGTAGSGLGDERGVEIGDAGTKVTSARGDISIIGRGAAGTDPVNTTNAGVWIRSSAVVESTATSGTAAKITIEGTGGAGSGGNFGFWINSSAQIISALGDISVEGQAGTGTADTNVGIWLQLGSSIVSTDVAQITLHGTGGSGTQYNMGIWVLDSSIRTHDGVVQLTGLGGAGTSVGNFGVDVSGSTVESTGLGDIRIHGTAGTGDSNEMGVRLFYAHTRILSTFGDIEVVGIGGGNPTGTSIFNAGVALVGGRIEALPGGDAAVTVTGTGGYGTSTPYGDETVGAIGVWVLNPQVSITAADGPVSITGTGGGSIGSDHNHGVTIFGDANAVKSTAAGNISINGTPGLDPATSFGIRASRNGGITADSTGNLSLIADSISLDPSASSVNLGTNTVFLHPRTAGTEIDLGGADAGGVLGLTDGELDRVIAGTIQVGDSDTGPITVSAPITRDLDPANLVLVTSAASGIVFSQPGATLDSGDEAFGIELQGSVVVGGGGTLAGTGTIDGNVTVQSTGTVAPGNSPGIITINGNYVQLAGSTLEIELDGTNPATARVRPTRRQWHGHARR